MSEPLEITIEQIKKQISDNMRVLETVGKSQIFLTTNWYTIDELKSMVSCLERMNEQAKASMGSEK